MTQASELPLLDAVKPIILRNNRWRCDHGWDIDLDDGSSNYVIYNNLCLHGGIKNREGFGRVVENNVMVNNAFHPHVWYANSGDVFRRNIVFGRLPAGEHASTSRGARRWIATCCTGRARRSQPARDGCRSRAAATSIRSWPTRSSSTRRSGDYRVKEGSPALALGFVNFPMDQFGVVSPELRQLARTPLPGEALAAEEGPRSADGAVAWGRCEERDNAGRSIGDGAFAALRGPGCSRTTRQRSGEGRSM